jgi:hypothetical protein
MEPLVMQRPGRCLPRRSVLADAVLVPTTIGCAPFNCAPEVPEGQTIGGLHAFGENEEVTMCVG